MNFLIFYSIGLSSFNMQHYSGLFFLWQLIANFFSGAYIPLNLFPDWLVQIGSFLPFQYIHYLPISHYLGKQDIVFTDFIIILAWILAFLYISKYVWYLGSKKYEAFGR